MTNETLPYLIPVAGDLRRKINALSGLWQRRWTHFLATAEADRGNQATWECGPHALGTPTYAAFAYVVTGERRWADQAAANLRRLRDDYDEGIRTSPRPDWDTWTYAAPRLRHAISLDWIWNSGALEPDEQRALADLFVEDSLRYPYVVLHHRIPPHANNQGTAQALNLVTIGYLFGIKRGNDACARHLLEFGLEHLYQQVALAPPSGHTGEGSTYHWGVEAPLIALSCATLEWISGTPCFEQALAPNGNSFRSMLSLLPKLIPPSQLLAGWDEHGYELGVSGTPLAYLAYRTGDRSWYDPIRLGDGWERSGHFAWMRDDHVWQWIFMPEPDPADDMRRCPYHPRPWAEDHVGGTLLDRAGERHLFQYWDISSQWPARTHMNPNCVQLEAWGSLLTLDGKRTPDDRFPLGADPRMQFTSWHQPDKKPNSWAAGCVAAHSCVWIDDAIDITVPAKGYETGPDQATTGQLVRHEAGDTLQLVTGEVAQFFDHVFTDLESMRRTSALVDETFWVMVDQMASARAHAYTWQLVLRTGAGRVGEKVVVRTPEQVVFHVVPLPTGGPDEGCELVDVPGFPSTLEQRCAHFRRVRSGTEVEFVTVLVPQLARRELADLTEGWTGKWDPDNRGEAEGWQHSGGEGAWQAMTFADTFYDRQAVYRSDAPDPDPTMVWMRRTVGAPAVQGDERLLLQLPRGCQIDVWIDGVSAAGAGNRTSHEITPRLLPAFVDVTESLGDGNEHEFVFRLCRQSRPGLVPPCKLHVTAEVRPPEVSLTDDGVVRVVLDDKVHTVELDRLRCPIPVRRKPTWSGDDPLSAARETAATLLTTAPATTAPRWDGTPGERRGACLWALKHPQAASHDRLLAALDDPDWVVRMVAARTLGELKVREAVPRLIRLVEEETVDKRTDPAYFPKYRLREMALYALGKIGDPAAMQACLDCMDIKEFYGVHRLAAEALGVMGDERAIPVLEKWVDIIEQETAGACERAIARIEERERSCSS